jgi:hypothetical protein
MKFQIAIIEYNQRLSDSTRFKTIATGFQRYARLCKTAITKSKRTWLRTGSVYQNQTSHLARTTTLEEHEEQR